MAVPMWVYGEDGIEIPFSEMPVMTDSFDVMELEMDEKERKRFVRKLKWEFLKAAVVFFFKKV